ncbi:hypothetical protein P154DRAFT_619010 [Amniculicola lignicola CBS 123094]|uniref:Uncharacterized protein n=1 Tax=Amniculicola lignicola CBS 123094 TaxID=1392246 RepID=A0A6A5WKF1_9PLEO|nr:hypothetical protein P154DRAFT_619010 [Amniculicola lignicola CBS 123094]
MASLDRFWGPDASTEPSPMPAQPETVSPGESGGGDIALSLFESIITTYPPILESLLSQIPTASVLRLYHTSRHLRDFLRQYPLAWRTLSFRLPQPAAIVSDNDGSDRDRHLKTYSFDALLKQIIQPCGTRLMSLDLCNTAVTGGALGMNVLNPRMGTLQHLSVRGCKNVSIKYHLVPFLEPFTLPNGPWDRKELALKSIYTYRCRHHRRRPYLPSSLIRRDSDSDPTHQLIEICHQLGIWTDTAWCPTPGGRCYRRKDYHTGRPGPQNNEVWVPFDRLWRSSNRLGGVETSSKLGATDGRLWEIAETGQNGEPLGTENGPFIGEGKHVPAHLRKSHSTFVEDVKCAQCEEVILERCESCSVRMHCMGCRKTLCASCAFNRPIPKKRVKTRNFTSLAFGSGATLGSPLSQASGSSASLEGQNRAVKARPVIRFWWAPGATRSPNLMIEHAPGEDSSDSEDGPNNGMPMPPISRDPPKLNMAWCCLEPIFSGGGGIAVPGLGLGGRGADKIRAAPLPRTKDFEDPDFSAQLRPVDYVRELKNNGLYEYVLGEDVDILQYLKQDNLDLQAETCPRGLCQDCHRSFRWKVTCRCCKTPICKEHDFRALKFRKCGYRDMLTERQYARTHTEPPRLSIPEFNPNRANGKEPERAPSAASSQHPPSTSDDTESVEEAPMSQSQILVPQFSPSAVDMSTSTSLSSHLSIIDPPTNSSSLPYMPVSSSRPRSFSASGVRGRIGPVWPHNPRTVNPIANPLPLPCNPRHPVQWEGCGSYFCHPRPVGDNRPQCPAMLKECTDCQVLVCDACVSSNPTCTCSYCTVNFHCPFCARKKENKAQCRLDEEIKAKKAAELRAQQKMEKEKEERGHADEMAGAVFEFFTFLTGEDLAMMWGAVENGIDDGGIPGMSELPAPSPDSITVTTEFGVTQEPNHFTVITAGPSNSATVDVSDGAEADIDTDTDPVVDGPPTLSTQLSQSQNTTPPPVTIDIAFEVQAEDMADDEDDLDLDDEEEGDIESLLTVDLFADDDGDNASEPQTTNTSETGTAEGDEDEQGLVHQNEID